VPVLTGRCCRDERVCVAHATSVKA
jgi:hypothetical protein